MKYLIEATGNQHKEDDYVDVEIPIEINIDGERGNTSIVIDLGNGKDWWVPISELDHLIEIIDILFNEK